jgi:hypothetical protein
MIEEGTYKAKVSSHQFGVSSKKETEYISIVFRIQPGQPHEGMRVEWKGWFTDKSTARTLESLQLCGWDGADLENLGQLEREVEIVVKHESDDYGEVTEKVAWVNEIGRQVGGRPMSKGQLRQLAERVKSGKGKAAAGDDFPPKTSGGNKDIPF